MEECDIIIPPEEACGEVFCGVCEGFFESFCGGYVLDVFCPAGHVFPDDVEFEFPVEVFTDTTDGVSQLGVVLELATGLMQGDDDVVDHRAIYGLAESQHPQTDALEGG